MRIALLRKAGVLAVVAVIVALAAMMPSVTQGQGVFNMPAGQTSLQFVGVGDLGNASDPVNPQGWGSVNYAYMMGKYDVTVGQYIQFLNAVAQTDTYGLYTNGGGFSMATDFSTIAITQTGAPGSYSYSYTGSYAAGINCPIYDISWEDAVRFTNWLQNGQPTGAEGTGTTETGAYTLNGATTTAQLDAVTRNPGARFFIPSANEWYKAAFYKGGGTNAGYWIYPTQSNTAPGNTLPDTGNNANYAPSGTPTDPTNKLTPVGAFSASPGPYRTFDMGGDIFQWMETLQTIEISPGVYQYSYPLKQCYWLMPSVWIRTTSPSLTAEEPPTAIEPYFGFRVGAAPLPGDANLDGQVDINDLTVVLANYNQTGLTWTQGAMDGDPTGTVDINDLTIVLANFNTSIGAGGAGIKAVPEPTTVLLAGIGLVALLACAWRRGK